MLLVLLFPCYCSNRLHFAPHDTLSAWNPFINGWRKLALGFVSFFNLYRINAKHRKLNLQTSQSRELFAPGKDNKWRTEKTTQKPHSRQCAWVDTSERKHKTINSSVMFDRTFERNFCAPLVSPSANKLPNGLERSSLLSFPRRELSSVFMLRKLPDHMFHDLRSNVEGASTFFHHTNGPCEGRKNNFFMRYSDNEPPLSPRPLPSREVKHQPQRVKSSPFFLLRCLLSWRRHKTPGERALGSDPVYRWSSHSTCPESERSRKAACLRLFPLGFARRVWRVFGKRRERSRTGPWGFNLSENSDSVGGELAWGNWKALETKSSDENRSGSVLSVIEQVWTDFILSTSKPVQSHSVLVFSAELFNFHMWTSITASSSLLPCHSWILKTFSFLEIYEMFTLFVPSSPLSLFDGDRLRDKTQKILKIAFQSFRPICSRNFPPPLVFTRRKTASTRDSAAPLNKVGSRKLFFRWFMTACVCVCL